MLFIYACNFTILFTKCKENDKVIISFYLGYHIFSMVYIKYSLSYVV